MIEEARARELGKAAFDSDDVVLGDARELNEGWFFPCIAKRSDLFTGVIVNKETGRPLRVTMHSPMERDPALYDRGYQFEQYDLVILTIANWEETVRTIDALHFVTLDTYYKHDRVWRVGRQVTEAEVRERLSTLPAIFAGRIDHRLEHLERAREAGWFEFKSLEYRGREDRG
jgi:hypothetical protein